MSLLKVSDNYGASIVGNFSTTAETITVDVAPVKTTGYLTVFDLNGNQFEKIKYAGVSGLNLTGCIRGLSFDNNTDTPVSGNAKELKNGMAIKMTVSQHYLNPVIDFVNQYNGKWMGAVANFAALPQPAEDGEVRVTLDDSKLYVYDLDTTTWNLAGAGGGAGTVYITTKLGTEAEGDDNMTFQLTSGSFPDKKYLQVYKNGVLMSEGASNDYIATGSNQAVFNSPVQDDDVITLLVVSVDIYNPAWNLVDGDILPDLNATHDIGSSTKQFKDLYLSGETATGTLEVASTSNFGGNVTGLDLVATQIAEVSFVLGTVYQNTTGKPIFIKAKTTWTASGNGAGGGNTCLYIGSTSTPTIAIDYQAHNEEFLNTQVKSTLSAIVPVGWYYKITAVGTGGTASSSADGIIITELSII